MHHSGAMQNNTLLTGAGYVMTGDLAGQQTDI